LTNVARHAAAKNVWLALRSAGTEIELTIRDDGSGFDAPAAMTRAARGGSFGLVSMQERTSLAGGSIDIHSTPGAGTEIRARFPAGAQT
jgi:signal transduction histidine kinase